MTLGVPKHQLRLVLVVPPAAERDVVYRLLSALRVGPAMVELKERAFLAPASLRRHVRAAAFVSRPHRALDGTRNPARREWALGGVVIRLGTDSRSQPRARGPAQLLPLDLVQQQGDCAVEDGPGIAVRDLAAQQRL